MRNNFYGAYRAAIAAAGIPYRNWHATRHAFATDFLKAGNSIAQPQVILRHTTPQMTQRYSHMGREYEYLQNAVNKMQL